MRIQNMNKLRKFVSPEFVFGEGARNLTGQYAKKMGGRKALVVTDPGIMQAGWTSQIIESLADEKIESVIFSHVTPNPRTNEVMLGASIYLQEECNIIISIGGGSPIDCAKGIGVVVSNNRDIKDFTGVDRVKYPVPPLICIPTTAGTGADISQFAILKDVENREKLAVISKIIVPDLSLIDPVTTTTLDNEQTCRTVIDSLSHALEAFVSLGSSAITDLHALDAVSRVAENINSIILNPKDISIRSRLAIGSLEAGLAFSNASLGLIHAMAHSLGGLVDLSHGECIAVFLDHVIEFNYSEMPERYETIGKSLGLKLDGMNASDKKAEIIGYFRQLKKLTGLDNKIRQMGVSLSDIPLIARKAMNDPCIVTNPRRPVCRDIEVIYEQAF